MEQRSGGIRKKVSGRVLGFDGGEESLSEGRCRAKWKKMKYLILSSKARQGTDVQARGCRSNSSSQERQSSSSDLNFGTFLSP